MKNNLKFESFYYTDEDKEKLYSAFLQCAKIFGCTYSSYIYEDSLNKTRLGFTTNPDWQNEYIGAGIINDCHLWKTVSKRLSDDKSADFILFWETVIPTNSHQKDILLYRTEKGIGQNGISFCAKFGNIREYLALAPGNNEPNFLYYLTNHLNIIRRYCALFRSISSNYLQNQ